MHFTNIINNNILFIFCFNSLPHSKLISISFHSITSYYGIGFARGTVMFL